eukprot:CAMPEP_0201283000 /NCGR_PEP_ID=MMETSP1317-20130820/7267_1 /ASSEMBLY_ACC=CAM_ASM_000770 /TAXON_ID=187299 /ORGANISM="Undescribed Undescribed, Strain Undescribed" /LENGTH=69 /DNA_ID=CAMNT_0047597615 /DNA_START=167 /DNA_END=376 /DNA_ORIENTATION=+
MRPTSEVYKVFVTISQVLVDPKSGLSRITIKFLTELGVVFRVWRLHMMASSRIALQHLDPLRDPTMLVN